ncbi:MAG: acylphosphatase [Candidatus Diapherotrites archaeon]|nr:acylphosphatase [Candidatus Diapherotrites archaeon]
MKRAHLIISGRVQGVFYRAAVRDAAREFDVTGFVRNCADGTVEVVAEGDDEEVKRFAEACFINDGTRMAASMEKDFSDIEKREYSDFSITY